MTAPRASETAFDDQDIVRQVERLSSAELDALPFGVVRLNADGEVSFFSRTEAEQSGYGSRPALGRRFFSELAPCMGSPEFRNRVEQAHADRTLDILFEHVGDFGNATRVLRIRLKAASDGGTWLLLQRRAA